MGRTRSLHKNDFLCLCDKWQMSIYGTQGSGRYFIYDSYSVPRLSYGVPRYLAYFCVLGCLSVLASFSYLAYQPLFGKCEPTLLPQNRAQVITRTCQMKQTILGWYTTLKQPEKLLQVLLTVQIWSSVTGYGELGVCFQPIRIGEIF